MRDDTKTLKKKITRCNNEEWVFILLLFAVGSVLLGFIVGFANASNRWSDREEEFNQQAIEHGIRTIQPDNWRMGMEGR